MKSSIVCLLAVLSLLFVALDAPAETVFSDDFENVTARAWPDENNYADPVAQIGRWTSFLRLDGDGIARPGIIQVVDNVTPGPAGSGSNYLASQRVAQFDTRAFADWASASSDAAVITIDFDFYLSSTSPNLGGMGFAVQEPSVSGTTAALGDNYRYIPIINSFRMRLAGSTKDQTDNFAIDTWHHVRYEINVATGTYSLTIANTTYKDLAFQVPVSSLGKMVFTHLSAGSTYFLDDITVEYQPVSEPG